MASGRTRREVLTALGRAGSLAAVTGAGATGFRLATFPIDLRNLRMAGSVLERLGRSAPVDWRYSWPSLSPHFTALPLFNNDDGGEGLQSVSAEAGYVSTARDGIAAGFTADGRMSTLLFPHTGFTHHLPYFAHDRETAVLGAKPHEGGFAGLRVDGRTTWLWDEAVDHDIGYVTDTGVLAFRYALPDATEGDADAGADATVPAAAGLRVDEEAYVLPGTETVVREFTVANPTDRRVDGEFVYHTQANVTANQQNFAVWHSSRNRLHAADALRWSDREGPYELLVYGDAPPVRSGAAVTGPDVVPLGPDGSPLDVERASADPRGAAGGSAPAAHPDGPGLLGNVLGTDHEVVDGRYLSGYLAFDLDVAPGERQAFTVFVTGGADVERLPAAERSSRSRRAEQSRAYWRAVTGDLRLDGIPARYHGPARRAAMTLLKLTDPESGSVSASGNLQPSYYPSWPRDGAFAAVALARFGHPDPAKRFLARFLPDVQERDGSFRQCYDSSGADAGLFAVENDQQPIYAWAVREVYGDTGDDAFLREAWPAVEAALTYTLGVVAGDGLLVAAPDIQEGPSAARRSLWTNAMAHEGLAAGGDLAAAVGADPAPYREAATTVGTALRDRFFRRDDYVTEVGFWGPTKDLEDYAAGAVWPSNWATRFGEADRLARDLQARYEAHGVGWVPGELLKVGALERAGRRRAATDLLDTVLSETAPAGYLAEETHDDGTHKLGSPLGWSSANLLLVLDELYR